MRSFLTSRIKAFLRDRNGSIAMLFPLAFLPVMMFIGAVIDYGQARKAKEAIQHAADAGAISAANMTGATQDQRIAMATNIFLANLPPVMSAGVTKTVSASGNSIVISASFAQPTAFMKLAGVDSVTVKAASTAEMGVTNGMDANICMLALSPNATDGFHIQGTDKVADRNCWAWVNSTAAGSMNATGTATASGAGFCTAGSVIGASHFTPAPQINCPVIADPLAGLALPAVSGCDHSSKVTLKNGTWTLDPGTYCGGIEIKPQAVVTFNPGLYIIVNGDLNVQGGSTATGAGVNFYFADLDSNLAIQGGGNVTFSAPTSGAWAGLLFMQSRSGTTLAHTVIQGGGTVNMTGVLYMPRRIVEVGGNGNVNADSNYFGMIADSFYLIGNGTIYLRSDYAAVGMPSMLPKLTSTARLTN